MPHIIAEPCIGTKDSSCVDVCPVECIYEADDQFYIHPEECIDCGACVPVCPPEAIFPEEDVPEEHEEVVFVINGNEVVGDTARNAAYFTDGPGYWEYDLEEERATYKGKPKE